MKLGNWDKTENRTGGDLAPAECQDQNGTTRPTNEIDEFKATGKVEGPLFRRAGNRRHRRSTVHKVTPPRS